MGAVSSWDTPGLPWPRGALPRGHLFGKELSAFINEIRTQAGMTQTELAAALDTTQPAVWKLEQARHMPSLGMLIRIAEATRTPMTLTAKLRYKGLYPGTLQLWPLPPEPHGPPGNRTFDV